MARQMKDSGVEWIGEIPETWNTIAFWQATERMATGLNPRDNFELTSDDEYYYVTIRNFKDGKLYLDDNCDRISAAAWNIIQERSKLQVGDILFASISKDGQAYIVDTPPVNWNINESVFVIRVNPEFYTPKYFYYHLTDDAYYADLRMDATGSTFQSIKQNKLSKSRLVLPSLHEQQRIAAFLDRRCAEIDAVIERTKATIEEYKKLKQAVITEAVTKGVRGERKMKDSGIEWIGEIPEEWNSAKLGGVTLSMRNGYVGPTRDLFYETGVRYIQSLHIKDGVIDFDKHPYYVSEEWANDHPKVHTNDILIVQTGDIGQVGIVKPEYDGCNCHALIIATPNCTLLSPRYLMFYLMSTPGEELLLSNQTGALLPHLNAGKIKFTPVLLPEIDEQEEIVFYLDEKCAALDTLIARKSALLTELEAYKKSLIYEYVTGKKEVQ